MQYSHLLSTTVSLETYPFSSFVQGMVCEYQRNLGQSWSYLNCFWEWHRFETGVSFSRGHVSEIVRCSRISQGKRPSLGLCQLGQNRCIEDVEAGCMGSEALLCSGGDVMNRSGDSCVYLWIEVRMRSTEIRRLISIKCSSVSEIVWVNCRAW